MRRRYSNTHTKSVGNAPSVDAVGHIVEFGAHHAARPPQAALHVWAGHGIMCGVVGRGVKLKIANGITCGT